MPNVRPRSVGRAPNSVFRSGSWPHQLAVRSVSKLTYTGLFCRPLLRSVGEGCWLTTPCSAPVRRLAQYAVAPSHSYLYSSPNQRARLAEPTCAADLSPHCFAAVTARRLALHCRRPRSKRWASTSCFSTTSLTAWVDVNFYTAAVWNYLWRNP